MNTPETLVPADCRPGCNRPMNCWQELRQVSQQLEPASPRQIIRWAAERFGDRLTMATAFGPEGMVILHFLAEIAPQTSCLQSGHGLPVSGDTRVAGASGTALRAAGGTDAAGVDGRAVRAAARWTLVQRRTRINAARPQDSRVAPGDRRSSRLDQRDPSRPEPDRARAAIVGWDKKFNLVKVNPLANWTKSDVWKLITEHDIPYNPLHDQGYASIGCWPCTRAVIFGEDERAGRWSGSAKTECGLHSLEEEKKD